MKHLNRLATATSCYHPPVSAPTWFDWSTTDIQNPSESGSVVRVRVRVRVRESGSGLGSGSSDFPLFFYKLPLPRVLFCSWKGIEPAALDDLLPPPQWPARWTHRTARKERSSTQPSQRRRHSANESRAIKQRRSITSSSATYQRRSLPKMSNTARDFKCSLGMCVCVCVCGALSAIQRV